VETKRFAGRRALVTGAGAGFGKATALGLAREGASHVALVELRPERLEAVGAEVTALGAEAIPIAVDLCDAGSASAVVHTTVATAGGLDVVISNHALMSWEVPFLDTTDEAWQREIDVSLTSHFALGRSAAQAVRDAVTRGSIAFTASVDALGAERGCAPYCVAKAGIVALTKVMAVDLAEHGIRVNCVSPGPGDTQRSVDLVGEETMQTFRETGFAGIPLVRLASVEDVAEAFLYLSSDAASYITGHNLIVDGGLTTFAYHLPEA
jgi:meso-butanediol dehydrogenase / (S,S)-butanediol dehydrogenase / diacetyl reductase